MTTEHKPEHSKADEKPIRPDPHAPKAAPVDSDRKKAAKKAFAEYQKAYSDDSREFDEVKGLPYGPLEIADLDIRHEEQRQERMKRFNDARKAAEKE